MLTLAIDTSTARGSAALLRDQEPLDERHVDRRQPGDQLFESIGALLERHCIAMDRIDLIVVGTGPGSFTGIRAGIAAARGLALPRSLPLKGISSFHATALTAIANIPPDCPQCCVLGDARRGEIYYQIYDRAAQPVTPCRIAPLEGVADEIHAPLWFISATIDQFADDIRSCFGGFATVQETPVFPSASALGWLGVRQYLRDDQEGDVEIAPLYLREVAYKKQGSQPDT